MKVAPLISCFIICIGIFFCNASTLQAQQQYEFYVSPNGNNSASGTTKEDAFKTIEKAQEALRTLKKQGKTDKPVVVSILGGSYSFKKPLVFTSEDSGTDMAPVTYQAAPGEEVVLNGGQKISDWKPYNNGIWMTKIPAVKQGKWKFRQLFVNGAMRTRARTPNNGFLRVKGFPDGGPEVHYHTDCQRFEYTEGDINPNWKNLNDVEVIVYHFWTDSHLPIQSIDAKNRIVTFKHKAGKVFTDDFSKDGARYIVENVWEGLDEPGEWYLNNKTGVLYYIPLPGEDMKSVEVVAPIAPEFIQINGKPLENKYVSNITFKNLSFEYSNYDLPPGNSNDAQGSASVPAAITLKGAKNIIFDRCKISNIGTFAFDISEGSQNNKIQNCSLSYLGAGGVRVNGGTQQQHPLLRTGNIEIRNNIIDHYGEVFPSAVGLLLMHTGTNKITNNEISNGSYTGVSVGWSWGYQRSISNHNLIANNYIHHIGSKGLLSDMGGIYMLGVSPGTIIRNNIIHDVNANHYGGWGIYNDEGTSHVLIENNLVYNTKFAPFNIHFSKEVTVRNNIFALGEFEQLNRTRLDPHKSVYFENNIIYWKEGQLLSNNWKDKPYTFYNSAIGGNKEMTSTFDFDYNLFYNPTKPLDSIKFNGESFDNWKKRGKDIHSVYASPMFIDAEKFDFRLKAESPAFKLGFKQIDFSEVGVVKKEVE